MKALAQESTSWSNSSTTVADIHSNFPIQDLIGLFESEVEEIVNYDSFEYSNSAQSIHLSRGSQSTHKCHYRITAEKSELGSITITRHSPFNDDEINMIEGALGALVIQLSSAMGTQNEIKQNLMSQVKIENSLLSLD